MRDRRPVCQNRQVREGFGDGASPECPTPAGTVDSLTIDEAAAAELRKLAVAVLGEAPRYGLQDAVALAGVDLERSIALCRSLGFAVPDLEEVIFTDSEVEAVRIAVELYESPTSLVLPRARALGQAAARMAEWQADQLRELVSAHRATSAAGEPGDDSLLAIRLQVWERLQQHVWRRHLLAAIERLVSEPDPAGSETATVIGFADIAMYTSVSMGLTESRLVELIETFEASSSQAINDHGGRVVKTIGDEVMFTVDAPAAAADIALALAERPNELDGRPLLHVGLAYGPVVRRLGDYYGTVVNLASRLTDLARPGTVLVDQNMAVALRENISVRIREMQTVDVPGFPDLQAWVIDRTD